MENTMEPPQLSEFEKCGRFISVEIYLNLGLDVRDWARTPDGHYAIFINKPYEGLHLKAITLQCNEPEKNYRMVVDGDNSLLSRTKEIAEQANKKYENFATVKVLTENDLL